MLDPLFDETIIILPFTNNNGSDVLTNLSPYRVLGSSLSVSINAVQSKYYGNSAYFNGVDSYIMLDMISSFLVGKSHTIEGWFYRASDTNWQSLFGFHTLTDDNSGVLLKDRYVDLASTTMLFDPTPIGQWFHAALTRDVTTENINIYIDGSLSASCSAVTPIDRTLKFSIGQEYDPVNTPSDFFQGYMQDFRVTAAVRYTENFTPPGPLARQISGKVTDYNSSNQIRVVRAYPRASGCPVYETISNTEGLWYLNVPDIPLYIVALDDDAGLVQNALIQDRVNA